MVNYIASKVYKSVFFYIKYWNLNKGQSSSIVLFYIMGNFLIMIVWVEYINFLATALY